MEWVMKSGKKINITDMETSHIRNAIAMLRRKGFVTPAELEMYLLSEPSGEAALDEYMRELDRIKTCLPLATLEAELKRRETGA